MTLHIELNKIQNIYNTFKKYYSYKTKLEKYLSSNQIYFMILKNDNNDNYSKLVMATKNAQNHYFYLWFINFIK